MDNFSRLKIDHSRRSGPQAFAEQRKIYITRLALHVGFDGPLNVSRREQRFSKTRATTSRVAQRSTDMYSPSRKRSDSTAGVVDLDMSNTEVETNSAAPAALEDLLSPTTKETPDVEKQEDDVAEAEAVDDDTRFSNVPLSADANGTHTRESTSTSSVAGRRSTLSFDKNGSPPSIVRKNMHKKSASSYTVGSSGRESAGNLPFLLHRLDLQKVQENTNGQRKSLDGQQRIQDELARLQNGLPTIDAEANDENAIDWGMHFVTPFIDCIEFFCSFV